VLRERSTLNHLLAMATLRQIGRAFDESDLAWVVMKGPAVAALLYPEPGDRSDVDLDLLVDRRDCPRAVRVLEVDAVPLGRSSSPCAGTPRCTPGAPGRAPAGLSGRRAPAARQ
jgi:hypothetical protein